MKNKSPAITILPPIICEPLTSSPRMKYAKTAAPTGSNRIAIEITFVLTYFTAQLKRVCPKRLGIMANNRNHIHSSFGYGPNDSPFAMI